jgi:hypothetical protein
MKHLTNEEIEKFEEEIVEKSKKLYDFVNSKTCKDDFKKCEKKEICIGCGYNQYCKLN